MDLLLSSACAVLSRAMYSPFPVQLAELTIEHVRAFLVEADEEGVTWEEKADGPADKGKRPRPEHVRRSVCGLANQVGGHVIIGAASQEGRWQLVGVAARDGGARPVARQGLELGGYGDARVQISVEVRATAGQLGTFYRGLPGVTEVTRWADVAEPSGDLIGSVQREIQRAAGLWSFEGLPDPPGDQEP